MKTLKQWKDERAYWQGKARMDTKSLSRTLRKVAEVEQIVAQIEAEKRGKKDNTQKPIISLNEKENTEFSQTTVGER